MPVGTTRDMRDRSAVRSLLPQRRAANGACTSKGRPQPIALGRTAWKVSRSRRTLSASLWSITVRRRKARCGRLARLRFHQRDPPQIGVQQRRIKRRVIDDVERVCGRPRRSRYYSAGTFEGGDDVQRTSTSSSTTKRRFPTSVTLLVGVHRSVRGIVDESVTGAFIV